MKIKVPQNLKATFTLIKTEITQGPLFTPLRNINCICKDFKHSKISVLLPAKHIKKKKKTRTVPLLNDA